MIMTPVDGAGSPVASKIELLLQPSLEAMGYGIVRIQFTGGRGKGATLQIMAERLDGVGMSVDDCAAISQASSAILDVADPIPGAYTLEVSSPGIDRPLVRPADFQRFAGFEARIETDRLIEGRKRFKGRIAGLETAEDGDRVTVADGQDVWQVPFRAITKAKLVLTDDLIAKSPDLPRV
jgi:ribosome maturation factor RimP